ncbi:MAG: SOS response-associated peptidase [Kordiimonadaceae bacterium]|nr:SOS response-associated peptidase [Kordiimonadaceae bacterium]
MCGRFSLLAPKETIGKIFDVWAESDIPPRYNIAPRQPVLVVRNSEEGKRHLAAVEWGLVPEWRKERSEKPLINARIETILEKPSFKSSIRRKRCLVPFTDWYEWRSEHGQKIPYRVRHHADAMGAFAGVWSTWHGPGGDFWLETMAIVTGPAEATLKPLHSRKPLVVRPEQYGEWLQAHDPLPRGFLESFQGVEEQQFEWTPVSRKVSSVRFEGPECHEPPEAERQASLF